MSQERWDVVVQYLDGVMAKQPPQVYRGPVVRIGANPGPGGIGLKGYRGLNDRHAVITAYDGGSVAIAPVGNAQVRVAPHGNVEWAEIDVLVGPSYLSDGCAVHLGSPERGVTFQFVEARRLGVWEDQRILSDAAQASPEVQPTNIKELSTQGGIPTWFVGGIVLMGLVTTVGVLASIIKFHKREIAGLGPVAEGREYYDFIDPSTPIASELRQGLQQPFEDFVMRPNADAASWSDLGSEPSKWDQKLFDQVSRSYQVHAGAWLFWQRLEQIEPQYATVVKKLKAAGLPEVFAAVPYQESRYRDDIQSPVCALGWWQFMPETATHFGLEVRDCRFVGSTAVWNPTEQAPPRNVRKNAQYVAYDEATDKSTCRIKSCARDERSDLVLATDAAIRSLSEAWNDADIGASGAAVQLTITSHNCGYNDSRFGVGRKTNVLPAYRAYLKDRNLNQGPYFLGDTMTCTAANFKNDACGGYIPGESQHYAYNVIAQHLLAVCYYGLNYSNEVAFKDWRKYTRGDGYCTETAVPDRKTVRDKLGL
ncbi:MAG: transglycosylase SLT domain-containing protein [Pseudomonadota bacterium]